MKIETFLPSFPGFYESTLYNSDMDYYLLRELISGDDRLPTELFREWVSNSRSHYNELKCRWEEYQEDAAKAYCEVIESHARSVLKGDISIEFSHVWSPKYYNFETDRLYCNIDFDAQEAIKYCADHAETFEKYLADHFKSRDGFISFMSYDMIDWMDAAEWDSRHAGHVLDFILRNEYGDEGVDDFALRVIEDVDYSTYCDYPPELEEFLDTDKCDEIAHEYAKQAWQCDEYVRVMKGTERAKEIAAQGLARLKKWLIGEIDAALEAY